MNTYDNENEIHSSALLEESDMCIHSIAKTDCRLCKYKCIHSRKKSYCKECGGSGICSHGRIKSQCKECGGGSICSHGRIKSQCKDCGGGSICSHGRIKSQCKDCGGGSICSHDKQKSKCKECGGGSICSHGRIKSQCKECGGGSICSHGRIKLMCKECGGSGICSHDREKYSCKECGGSRICSHGKFKSTCKSCGGSALCKSSFCETRKNINKKYNGYCTRCYIHLFPDEPISRNYKTKEYAVLEFIRNNYPDHTWVNNKKVEGGSSGKRPDILLKLHRHNIIIEIDENQHRSYDNCELKRMNLLFEDLEYKHTVFIRFNPDDYLDKDNKKITSCWGIDKNGLSIVKKSKQFEWEHRLDTLKNIVDRYLTINEINVSEPITNEYLFYDSISFNFQTL